MHFSFKSADHFFKFKARSDLRKWHAFTQKDREFSNCPHFTGVLKLNYPNAFYAPCLNEPLRCRCHTQNATVRFFTTPSSFPTAPWPPSTESFQVGVNG